MLHTKTTDKLCTDPTIGGPSSSCEMIILWNKSHGEVIRVCIGIFTTALRNKKNPFKFSMKIPHLTFTVHCLLSDRLLCWKEPILAIYLILGLLLMCLSPFLNSVMFNVWYIHTFMNHFFQRIVPALQNFYDISDSLIWHLYVYICCF